MPVAPRFDRNAALLIIDVQQAMDSPVWGARNSPELISRLRSVLECWRELRWPVYFVADDSTNPNSPYYPGQPGNDFKPELAPLDGEPIVRKSSGSAFVGTDLEAQLRGAGHQILVVGGFMTNKCVESTVRVAADLGFAVYVLADGTAAVGQIDYRGRWWDADDVHHLALANMRGERTRLIDVAQLLANAPTVDRPD